MQQWKPKSALGAWVALVGSILLLIGAVMPALHLWQVVASPPEMWDISPMLYGELLLLGGGIILGGFLLYRALATLTLSYEMDRNGVYVQWLDNRLVIPIDEIVSVDIGDAKARLPWGILQQIGSYWGHGATSEGLRLQFFSTQKPAKSLLLHTNTACYALSPDDQDSFVQNLEQRRRLGATTPLTASYQYGRLFSYWFWGDQVIKSAFLLAIGLNLLLVGILVSRYPALGEVVHMRFNSAGEVTELRPRHQILFLPLASFGLILLNTGLGLAMYRQQKVGARLLQVASVLMPVLFGIAMLMILSH
jgi:hypothetical protein